MKNTKALKEIEYYCTINVNNICPFTKSKCKKLVRSEQGVCSFQHKGIFEIVCPERFREFDFEKIIAKKIMNCDSYYCFREVKIENNFLDYLLVDKDDKTNYCAVELQALDTTGNYKWVFGEHVKPYCINWKATKKTIISQLITKSTIINVNNKPIVLVIQDSLFDYLKLKPNGFCKEKLIHVLVAKYNGKRFLFDDLHSFTFNDLIQTLYCDKNVNVNLTIEKLVNRINKSTTINR